MNFLRSAYRKPRDLSCVYDNLSRGTIYGWFHSNGVLKDNIKRCVEIGTYFAKSTQHCQILASYPLLKEKICEVLKKQRIAGQLLYGVCIQDIIKSIISKRQLHMLEDSSGFCVSYKWTLTFIKAEMNWSYRAATTSARKIPFDYEVQGKKMTERCAYLVKIHSIAEELVVNTDQASIHLVPTGGARTWEEKNSKHVKVQRMEDKRQVIVVVSLATNGNILPFQMIFQGLTPRSLPPKNDGRVACEDNGWHLTFSSNHWSTLDTCKDFVNNILLNYRISQIELLGLSTHQDLIWLIDCWSVHISKEFRAWMKNNHPRIHLLFIPANCTYIFQPTDVIPQRPFKHAFRVEFNKFTMEVISD